MMEYKGYQIQVNGLKLPIIDENNDSIFETSSYNMRKYYPVIEEWTDATGKIHRELEENKKAEISFTIKEHSFAQHRMLEPLLRNNENIFVEYWDDNEADYKTGYFFMDGVEAVTSIATRETIYYDALNIKLMEY